MNALPLSAVDEQLVHDIQGHLCKSIRLAQALLHLKGKYAGVDAEIHCLKLAKDEVVEGKRKVEKELSVAKATTRKATEELLLTKEELEKTSSDIAKLQEVHTKSMDPVMACRLSVLIYSWSSIRLRLLLLRKREPIWIVWSP